jgi:predicted anti-sigma-YlaC factor YlaD
MNHKQFEKWILDEPQLNASQEKELKQHLAVCTECRRLQTGWQASKQLLSQTNARTPAPGFDQRWGEYVVKKRQIEKVRRYRLTLFSLLMIAFATSLTYMVASGSFMFMLADIFNAISNMIIGITRGLSSLGSWLYQMPVAVPISIGFIFFGLMNAFIMVGVFILWDLKQRKLQTNEIQAD